MKLQLRYLRRDTKRHTTELGRTGWQLWRPWWVGCDRIPSETAVRFLYSAARVRRGSTIGGPKWMDSPEIHIQCTFAVRVSNCSVMKVKNTRSANRRLCRDQHRMNLAKKHCIREAGRLYDPAMRTVQRLQVIDRNEQSFNELPLMGLGYS